MRVPAETVKHKYGEIKALLVYLEQLVVKDIESFHKAFVQKQKEQSRYESTPFLLRLFKKQPIMMGDPRFEPLNFGHGDYIENPSVQHHQRNMELLNKDIAWLQSLIDMIDNDLPFELDHKEMQFIRDGKKYWDFKLEGVIE